MDKKTRPIYILPPSDTFQIEIYRLKVKGWKRYFMQMRKKKKAEIALLISNKIDFKTKAIVRDKGGHYIMIKWTIQQEDITLVNIYTPTIGAAK